MFKINKYITIPKKSIIVSNHPSLLDGFLILFAIYPLKPMFICNKWSYKKCHLIAKLLGIKLVENNVGGTLKAIRHLKQGRTVVIFPEGSLTKDSKKIYRGFITLAKKTKTDIYCIKIIKRGLLNYTLNFNQNKGYYFYPSEALYNLFYNYCIR